jgi:hypothetical protein
VLHLKDVCPSVLIKQFISPKWLNSKSNYFEIQDDRYSISLKGRNFRSEITPSPGLKLNHTMSTAVVSHWVKQMEREAGHSTIYTAAA